MRIGNAYLVYAASIAAVFLAAETLAHVTVSPRESSTGSSQTYTMRVPTERDSPTVRIEAELPAEVTVIELEAKAGWDIAPDRRRGTHRRGDLERRVDCTR